MDEGGGEGPQELAGVGGGNGGRRTERTGQGGQGDARNLGPPLCLTPRSVRERGGRARESKREGGNTFEYALNDIVLSIILLLSIVYVHCYC